MIHRLRVFADTRRQRRAGVRTTRDRTPPPRHRYSLVASATIASPRNLTIPDRNCREFAHTNKPLILFHFGATEVSVSFLSPDSILRASRIFRESSSRLTTQFSNTKFQVQDVDSLQFHLNRLSSDILIVEAKRIRRISIRREPISIYIGIISRDENSAADRLPRPLEVRSRTRGKKGRVTGHLKLTPPSLIRRVTALLTFFHPSFLPSVLPLSRPWNVVTRALRGENFCTHVFRVSHRCFIKPGPSGEGSSDLESTPARAQVSGDTRGMGEGSECRVGVARHPLRDSASEVGNRVYDDRAPRDPLTDTSNNWKVPIGVIGP